MAGRKKRRRKGPLRPILKPGRPSKFQPNFTEHARVMCANGATDREVAQYLGIDDATLYRWRWAYPEFREALRIGKAHADERVEMSLYRRATGYSFDSIHFSSYEGDVTETPFVEHLPPDVGAIKLWLTNRRPAQWREKIDIEQSGTIIVEEIDPTDRGANYQRKGAGSV